MNILFDFLPMQLDGGVGGAASFAYRVFLEVLARRGADTQLFAAYDKRYPFGKLYPIEDYQKHKEITLVDISSGAIASQIEHYGIDTFFITIGQFVARRYDLTGIKCRTITFIHDIFDIECCDNRIEATLYDERVESKWAQTKRLLNVYLGRMGKRCKKDYAKLIPFYASANNIAYTVSSYTQNSLRYYFPELNDKDIRVCYSPAKQVERMAEIENPELRKLITEGKPYLLMLAANRRYKNPRSVIRVFDRLQKEYPDLRLLTLKYGKKISAQHIDIPFLSDSDLDAAYEHAHALIFASFFEGFGYPPVEAMRWGVPTVASNVTSIPEILGEAAFYFSPYYPADLYCALKQVLSNRDALKEQLQMRYEEISQRQESDLRDLVNTILG